MPLVLLIDDDVRLALAALLEGIRVSVYGEMMPLKQVGQVVVRNATLMVVNVYDQQVLSYFVDLSLSLSVDHWIHITHTHSLSLCVCVCACVCARASLYLSRGDCACCLVLPFFVSLSLHSPRGTKRNDMMNFLSPSLQVTASVEKAIRESNLNLNPAQEDANIVHVPIPK